MIKKCIGYSTFYHLNVAIAKQFRTKKDKEDDRDESREPSQKLKEGDKKISDPQKTRSPPSILN
jgi:hypothetical protein